MVRFNKNKVLLASTAVAAVMVANTAFAGGFALREQSSYYQGMSFAGNATSGPSISSMFWNPAAITGAKQGLTSEAHNSFIIPRADVTGTNTVGATALPFDLGDIGSDAWIGASYAAYNLNDKFYFGLGINAPYGLSTKSDQFNWSGAGYNRSSRIFSINVNPVVGYKLNDMVSFAFGAQIQYLDMRLNNSLGVPLTPAGQTNQELEGDDIGFGITAGVTVKPFQGTEIGVGFRSGVAHTIEGKLNIGSTISRSIETSFVTPEVITISAKQSITDDIRVLGTFEWTNWSRLGTPKIINQANGATVAPFPLNYEDGYFLALGGEYDWNQHLTLRAGVAYEWSPIDTGIRSARLPDNDRFWLSGGLSYNFNDKLAFDLGYTHIFTQDTDIKIVPGHQDYNVNKGSLIGKADAAVDIFSASMRYTF